MRETIPETTFYLYTHELLGKQLTSIWMDMGTMFLEIGVPLSYINKKGILRNRGEYTLMVTPSWRFCTNKTIKCTVEMTEQQIMTKTRSFIGSSISEINLIKPLNDLDIQLGIIHFMTFTTCKSHTDWTLFYNEISENGNNSKSKYWIRNEKGQFYIERGQNT